MTGLPSPYIMRSVCVCGSKEGSITETGAQDVVRCAACNKFQYNAPRVETGKAVRSVSTTHAAISPRLRAEILMRAGWRCQCCGRQPTKATEELHVSHCVSVASGHELGLTDDQINNAENLMASCAECNLGLGKETVPVWLLVAALMARLKREK